MKDETRYQIQKVWSADTLNADDLRYEVALAFEALALEIQQLEERIKKLEGRL